MFPLRTKRLRFSFLHHSSNFEETQHPQSIQLLPPSQHWLAGSRSLGALPNNCLLPLFFSWPWPFFAKPRKKCTPILHTHAKHFLVRLEKSNMSCLPKLLSFFCKNVMLELRHFILLSIFHGFVVLKKRLQWRACRYVFEQCLEEKTKQNFSGRDYSVAWISFELSHTKKS